MTTLTRARIPVCLGPDIGLVGDIDGLAAVDISIADGRISAIAPSAGQPGADDRDGGIILPCLVDVHTHLDKGHIWPRRRNPDGTFMGGLENASGDREANWTAADVRARMDFSLRCAYAHGTSAIRTHLDSMASRSTFPGRCSRRSAPTGSAAWSFRQPACSASSRPRTRTI